MARGRFNSRDSGLGTSPRKIDDEVSVETARRCRPRTLFEFAPLHVRSRGRLALDDHGALFTSEVAWSRRSQPYRYITDVSTSVLTSSRCRRESSVALMVCGAAGHELG
jgi:hypothetical protein